MATKAQSYQQAAVIAFFTFISLMFLYSSQPILFMNTGTAYKAVRSSRFMSSAEIGKPLPMKKYVRSDETQVFAQEQAKRSEQFENKPLSIVKSGETFVTRISTEAPVVLRSNVGPNANSSQNDNPPEEDNPPQHDNPPQQDKPPQPDNPQPPQNDHTQQPDNQRPPQKDHPPQPDNPRPPQNDNPRSLQNDNPRPPQNDNLPQPKPGHAQCLKQVQYWGAKQNRVKSGTQYNCPDIQCKVRYINSKDYSKLVSSDAVILHHRSSWDWDTLIKNRPVGQIWIYATRESPIHSKRAITPGPSKRLDGQHYNWSMTYRSDSEIVDPYGRFIEGVPEVGQNDSRNWASGKTKLIAWMASNCGVTSWGRKKFVNALQNYMQVDTYGGCGKLRCPRNQECDRILSSHKFYLALENSECREYITEKFWRNAFKHDCVPVVYGAPKSDYEKLAPPNSFIHIEDFKSMKELVDYINLVASNDTLYNKYFEWKKQGAIRDVLRSTNSLSPEMLCSVAKQLQDIHKIKTANKVINMNSWWKSTCKHRQLFPFI